MHEHVVKFGSLAGFGTSQPKDCLRFVYCAIRARQCGIFANTTAIEQASCAVVACSCVDLFACQVRYTLLVASPPTAIKRQETGLTGFPISPDYLKFP